MSWFKISTPWPIQSKRAYLRHNPLGVAAAVSVAALCRGFYDIAVHRFDWSTIVSCIFAAAFLVTYKMKRKSAWAIVFLLWVCVTPLNAIDFYYTAPDRIPPRTIMVAITLFWLAIAIYLWALRARYVAYLMLIGGDEER